MMTFVFYRLSSCWDIQPMSQLTVVQEKLLLIWRVSSAMNRFVVYSTLFLLILFKLLLSAKYLF